MSDEHPPIDLSTLGLRRWDGADDKLRAWDAADQYLLKTLEEEKMLTMPKNILILNDGFGALSLPLHQQHAVLTLTDSATSTHAIRENEKHLQNVKCSVRVCTTFEVPLNFKADLCLFKVPKSLEKLTHQVKRISSSLGQHTQIIGAGMTRKIHTSTLKMLEAVLGPTRTTRAVKKARLIHISAPSALGETFENHHELRFFERYDLGSKTQSRCHTLAGCFAHGKLDRGSDHLLNHLPSPPPNAQICDLGCGSGILGLTALLREPSCALTLVDEEAAAVWSAKRNAQELLGSRSKNVRCIHAKDLSMILDRTQDWVLLNPPFHDDGARNHQIASAMFKDARRVLKPGGSLWVVGNRHLNYFHRLTRLFGHCQHVGADSRYSICYAQKM